MKFETQTLRNLQILKPIGRIDSSVVEAFEEQASKTLRKTERVLIFDLAQTSYLSSAALRSLLNILREANLSQKKIYFCNCSVSVMDIFNICGFKTILNIENTIIDILDKES